MAAALASHLSNLRTALLSLKATGAKGFEGLIGVALAEVADAPFRLAGSGSQFGLDGPTSYKGDGPLYECKRYKSNVPRSDRLREKAAERRRFGYRRLHILLNREGIRLNHKKLRWLYREEHLQVRRRGGRKRALGTRAPMTMPQGANQRRALDFLSDTLTDSRRFRVLAVVDDFTRECLCLVADTSLLGMRVVRELGRLIAHRGTPLTIVSDNGTEFTSMAILSWS